MCYVDYDPQVDEETCHLNVCYYTAFLVYHLQVHAVEEMIQRSEYLAVK